jgi:DNA-binding NtrC family response regulator
MPAVVAADGDHMGAATGSAEGGRRPCVLVVEPDFQIRDMLIEALEGAEVDIVAVQGGRAARGVLDTRPVDFALIELVLPDDDGEQVAEAARGKGARVAVTSGHPDAIRRSAEQTWLFLQKPFGMHEVRTLVLVELGMAADAAERGAPPSEP